MKNPAIRWIYSQLWRHYADPMWWPADTPFEVMVGAVLTQNTNWNNAEKAITNLKDAGLLSLEGIACNDIGSYIRSSGFYRQKEKCLKALAAHIIENYKSNIQYFLQTPLDQLRTELTNIKGIGPETADAILLYAGEKPVFVIDAYTRRLCLRFPLTNEYRYERLRKYFENNIPSKVKNYQVLHALIVQLCKEYCRKTPKCRNCPLNVRCQYPVITNPL